MIDPNSVATWVDLFDFEGDPLTIYESELTQLDTFGRASVHRWTKHSPPFGVVGDTIVSGSGGINQLQPLSRNAFASFGDVQSKVDGGVIRFTAAFVGLVNDAAVEYGIHFNTVKADDLVGSNLGYALLFNSDSGLPNPRRLTLYRVDRAAGGAVFNELAVVSDADVNVLSDNVIELRWTQAPGVFGEPNNISVFFNPDLVPTPVISFNFADDPFSTLEHQQGGLFGVCARDPGAVLGAGEGSFITRFEYRNIVQPLSAYFDESTQTPLPYRTTEGGLYESFEITSPSGIVRGNLPPSDYLRFGINQSGEITPRSPAGAEDRDNGRIGFAAFGLSTSGQMFNAFMRMANDNDFLQKTFNQRRNPLVTLVNICQAGATSSEVAGQGACHSIWATARQKLEAAGLAVRNTGEVTDCVQPGGGSVQVPLWEAPQVQVVWLNLGDVIGAVTEFNAEGASRTDNSTMGQLLLDIRDQLSARFPNLRLVLCADFPYMGWVRFADGGFSEPNMAESLRFGYRSMIREVIAESRLPVRPATFPWVGWLGELFGNIDVWPEIFYPRNNQGHPNAAGEENGALMLLDMLFKHFSADLWWSLPRTDFGELDVLSVEAVDNASLRNYFPSYARSGDPISVETLSQKRFNEITEQPDLLNPPDIQRFVGANQREKVLLKFVLPTFAQLRQALLQIHYWSNEDFNNSAAPCTVRVVESVDANGQPWNGETLTWETAPREVDPALPSATLPPASREHPVTIDITNQLIGFVGSGAGGGEEVSFEVAPFQATPGATEGAEGELVESQFRWHSLADRLTNPTRSPQLILVARTLQPVGPFDFVFPDRRER